MVPMDIPEGPWVISAKKISGGPNSKLVPYVFVLFWYLCATLPSSPTGPIAQTQAIGKRGKDLKLSGLAAEYINDF